MPSPWPALERPLQPPRTAAARAGWWRDALLGRAMLLAGWLGGSLGGAQGAPSADAGGVPRAPAASAADRAGRLEISADGLHVIDRRAQLAWSRCVEGMQWDGWACTGEPVRLTYAQAVARAQARSRAEGGAWRLPRVTELQRLVSEVARSPQGVETLLPAAPLDWHWTATASVDTRPVNPYDYGNIQRGVNEQSVNRLGYLHGWAVKLADGSARGDVSKRTRLPLRLVRPWDGSGGGAQSRVP